MDQPNQNDSDRRDQANTLTAIFEDIQAMRDSLRGDSLGGVAAAAVTGPREDKRMTTSAWRRLFERVGVGRSEEPT